MKHIAILLVAALLSLNAPAFAQKVAHPQWVEGLDVIVSVYTTDGGPRDSYIGYDRDTQRITVLDVPNQCYVVWTVTPIAGAGGITNVLQIGTQLFGLYHENGQILLERQPASFTCNPVFPH